MKYDPTKADGWEMLFCTDNNRNYPTDIMLEANTYYEFSFWYKNPTGDAKAKYCFKTKEGLTSTVVADSKEWKQVTFKFNTGNTKEQVKNYVIFVAAYSGDASPIYIDDIKLIKTEAPVEKDPNLVYELDFEGENINYGAEYFSQSSAEKHGGSYSMKYDPTKADG